MECGLQVHFLFLLEEHVWGLDSIMDGYLLSESEDYEVANHVGCVW